MITRTSHVRILNKRMSKAERSRRKFIGNGRIHTDIVIFIIAMAVQFQIEKFANLSA